MHMREFEIEPFTSELVERAERLVEQQHIGACHQQSCQGHALLHAAGQLAGVDVFETAEPGQLEPVAGLDLVVLGDTAMHGHGEQHILQGSTPRQQCGFLEHHSDFAARFADRGAV